jgi:hypothetical protein
MTFKSFVVDSKIIPINSNDLQMLSSFRLSRVYRYEKHSNISGSERKSQCYSSTFCIEMSNTICCLFINGTLSAHRHKVKNDITIINNELERIWKEMVVIYSSISSLHLSSGSKQNYKTVPYIL